MTTVPFVIDQGLSHKYLPKRLVEVAEKAWPEERRHRFFRLLCAMGFAIASFQAFDHVNTELKKVRAQAGYIANRWPALSPEESTALRDRWRGLPPHHLAVLCAIPSCADLAQSVYDVAKSLNWPATCASIYFQNSGIGSGIEIWSYPEKARDRDQIAVGLEDATKGRLKISFREWPRAQSLPEKTLDGINLVIGRLE